MASQTETGAGTAAARNTTKAFDIYRETEDGDLSLVATGVEASGRGEEREEAAILLAIESLGDALAIGAFHACPAGSMSRAYKVGRQLQTVIE
jgi:hypothetical protein